MWPTMILSVYSSYEFSSLEMFHEAIISDHSSPAPHSSKIIVLRNCLGIDMRELKSVSTKGKVENESQK